MPKTISETAVATRRSGHVVALMLLMVVIPAAITLHTVRVPEAPAGFQFQPYSVWLYLEPVAVHRADRGDCRLVPAARRRGDSAQGVLAHHRDSGPCGAGLDFFFARWFFHFPNAGATLGIAAPALGKSVPIEEYVFYLTGFIAVLLIYIWADEYWFAAYSIGDYRAESIRIPRLLQFHGASLALGLGLIIAGIVYKKFFSPSPEGFPGYFTFLVATALVPSAAFFPSARPFINWRAFSLTMFIVVLISLIWEATLAVPYGWWGFQENQMLGLSIGAWYGLPIEEVGLWIAVSYATVIVFEIVKLWQASGKKAKRAFMGIGKA